MRKEPELLTGHVELQSKKLAPLHPAQVFGRAQLTSMSYRSRRDGPLGGDRVRSMPNCLVQDRVPEVAIGSRAILARMLEIETHGCVAK